METKADAFLFPSLGVHARILLPGVRDRCEEEGLKDNLLDLGGKFIIDESKWEDLGKVFSEMGPKRVHPPYVPLFSVVEDLGADRKRQEVAR